MARDYGYIISPSLSRYDFSKGKNINGSFTLTNSFVTGEPQAQTFVLSVKFLFQENGNKYIYDKAPSGKQAYDMTSWITLAKQEVTLKQNESIEIPYTITVPIDALPGGKYAAIVIEKKAGELLQSSGAVLNDKVAFQLLGEVTGTEVRDSEILSFNVEKPVYWFWPKEQIRFDLDFRNKGNTEFLPSGDIFVHTGNLTESFWNAGFNPEQLVILPENTRQYYITWTPKTGGIFTSDRNGLTINLDYFRIGKYYATAKVGYDVNNKRIIKEESVSFWIIPLPLLAVLSGIILTGILVKILRNRLRKRK